MFHFFKIFMVSQVHSAVVTSITSGRLMVFKKTVWVGIKPKHEKCCGLSPEDTA